MKSANVFEPIEPPPGGLTRLRVSMSEPRRPFRWSPVLAGALAVALLCVGRAWILTRDNVDLVAEMRDSIFSETANAEPVALGRGQPAALQRLPSGNPQVVLYRVAMLDPSMTPPADEDVLGR